MAETVILSGDVRDFFRQEILRASSELRVELADVTEYYLVELLSSYASTGSSGGSLAGDEPLAMLYKKALDSSGGERVTFLKKLGDDALYLSGFFTESIEDSLVDLNYYIAMGGNAYTTLGELTGGRGIGQAYRRLGRCFTEMVDVLNEVSEHTRGSSDLDLLRAYDRFVRTGSTRCRKKLLSQGLSPTNAIPLGFIQ